MLSIKALPTLELKESCHHWHASTTHYKKLSRPNGITNQKYLTLRSHRDTDGIFGDTHI